MMTGIAIIAKLTSHFRKYETQNREVVFMIHGHPARYRLATIRHNNTITEIVLTEVTE